MSWSFIDEGTPTTITGPGQTSMTFTFPSTANVGDTLVITWLCPTAGLSHISSISQTGVTWTRADNHTPTTARIEIWYGVVTSAPGTVATINFTVAVSGTAVLRANGSRYTCSGTVSLGVSGAGTAATAATRPTETISPTAGKSALFIAVQRGAGTFSSGPTNSFNALASGSTGFTPAYLIVGSTTGTYSTSWTYTTSQAYDTTDAVLYETPVDSGPPVGGGLPAAVGIAVLAFAALAVPALPQRPAQIATIAEQVKVPVGTLGIVNGMTVRAAWPDPTAGGVQPKVQIAPLTLAYGDQPPIAGPLSIVEAGLIRSRWELDALVQRGPNSAAWNTGLVPYVPLNEAITGSWLQSVDGIQRRGLIATLVPQVIAQPPFTSVANGLIAASWQQVDIAQRRSVIAPLTLVYGSQPIPDDALTTNELNAIGSWWAAVVTPLAQIKNAAWNVPLVTPASQPIPHIPTIEIASWSVPYLIQRPARSAWNLVVLVPGNTARRMLYGVVPGTWQVVGLPPRARLNAGLFVGIVVPPALTQRFTLSMI